VDEVTGKKVWQVENLHIDATPLIHNGVVFVGSYRANDNLHKDLRLLALDAETGAVIWSVAIDLSSYSRPAIVGDVVYFSLGTGNLESSGPKPAGAVVAMDAKTGMQIWRADLRDSVFGSPLVEGELVLAGCNDGAVYALSRIDGQARWRHECGEPVVGAPEFENSHSGSVIVVISNSGRCIKLDTHDGKLINEIDLVRAANGTSGLFYGAPVVSYRAGLGRRIYVAGAVTRGIRETPVLFCLTDGY
jgi:outer membrane protein assembly factor BamB